MHRGSVLTVTFWAVVFLGTLIIVSFLHGFVHSICSSALVIVTAQLYKALDVATLSDS